MRGLTFGTPFFETEAGRVEPDAELHFAVLLLAAVADPEVGVPRDELAQLLWPRVPLEAARHSLRQAMYRIRQLAIPLHLRRGQVMLDEEDTEVDLRDLLRGTIPKDELLRVATQGFLPGFFPRISDGFTQWLQDLRDRADRVRRTALVDAVADARTNARFREIHKLAPVLLALDPFNEVATLAYAEALVMDGSKVQAIRMLEAYEAEVGPVSEALRLPARTLRRRVSECLDDALLPRKFEVPFVGREVEFKLLRDAFVQTRQGFGQAMVVTGDPGMGKTRISTELLRLSVLDGAMVITYPCTAGDTISPLSSLLTLTQALLNQPGALGCDAEHLQYLRRILSPDPAPTAPMGGMGADVAYAQLVYSLSELTAAITHEGPLVVFIDDAHRLHQTSWRIFSDVVARLPDKRVLLLLAARQLPEWFGSLQINGSEGRLRHVRLPAFTAAVSGSFVALWGEKNSIDTSAYDVPRMTASAQGNPFYLGELVAHLARGGEAGATPEAIRGLIERQYLALSKAAQRVLLVIGMMQTYSTVARVQRVLKSSPETFTTLLDELEVAGLIRVEGEALAFRHDLIGEVCLTLAPTSVVAYLRARVAAALEREGMRLRDADLLSLASTHWESSRNTRAIYRTAMAMGRVLLSVGLCGDAVSAFQKARAAADSRRTQAFAIAWTIRTLGHAAEWNRLLSLQAEEHTTLRALRNPDLADEVRIWTTEATLFAPARAVGLEQLSRIYIETSRPLAVRLRAARVAVVLADNSLCGHSYLAAHRTALRELLSNPQAGPEGAFLALIIATISGDTTTALAAADHCAGLIDALPGALRVRALRYLGYAMMRTGHTAHSTAYFARSLQQARELQLRVHSAVCLDQLARLALQEGDLGEAARLTEELRASVAPGDGILLPAAVACLDALLGALNSDAPRAKSALATLSSITPEDFELEYTNCVMTKAAAQLALQQAPTEDDLTRMTAPDEGLLRRGCMDPAVLSAAALLTSSGRVEAASALAKNYLTKYRVETRPVAPALLSLGPRSSPAAAMFAAATTKELGAGPMRHSSQNEL